MIFIIISDVVSSWPSTSEVVKGSMVSWTENPGLFQKANFNSPGVAWAPTKYYTPC